MSKLKWFRAHVERCLQDIWGGEHVNTDDDGDYPFRYGTAGGFVRIEPGSPIVVRVFAFATVDTPRTSKLLTELNDVNGRSRTATVSWSCGRVVVEQVLHAKAVRRSTLGQALDAVSFVADDIGTMIATVFGGHTPFPADDAEITEEAS